MKRITKINPTNKIAVDVNELKEMLGVGKVTANKVGTDAGAVIRLGRRKLFKLDKVIEYLDSITE